MLSGFAIQPPFFEIGPKAYVYGDEALRLARIADEASAKYGVKVIFTPQPTDLYNIARHTQNLLLCAQHIDPLCPGRGLGAILPEAVRAAGAKGAMLNHAEKPLPLGVLRASILRAQQAGLFTIVCADSIAEASAIAHLAPDIIVCEPSDFIGGEKSSDEDYVRASTQAVKRVDARIRVLQGAGIRTGGDVYRVILAGADATGSSSAVCASPEPEKLINEMLRAAREAYDQRTKSNERGAL